MNQNLSSHSNVIVCGIYKIVNNLQSKQFLIQKPLIIQEWERAVLDSNVLNSNGKHSISGDAGAYSNSQPGRFRRFSKKMKTITTVCPLRRLIMVENTILFTSFICFFFIPHIKYPFGNPIQIVQIVHGPKTVTARYAINSFFSAYQPTIVLLFLFYNLIIVLPIVVCNEIFLFR